ncbi:MAG: GNAT family N-acetyltransferase [Oscillospiraceae bacterium]|jgi:GNAT superfamily N-acetyltransferase|nr:GNAT family N-acetyltransferase [Oscillospiraceae bacterium]
MNGIIFDDTRKDLPPKQLYRLFVSVGWADSGETSERIAYGYRIPWINSTLVVSAWEGERLVGAVRVLSDTMFRSIIYDLLVLPEYQGKGIGKELVSRCVIHFPNSEWLVQTTEGISGYYKKLGFKVNSDVFLSVPCKLFTQG